MKWKKGVLRNNLVNNELKSFKISLRHISEDQNYFTLVLVTGLNLFEFDTWSTRIYSAFQEYKAEGRRYMTGKRSNKLKDWTLWY